MQEQVALLQQQVNQVQAIQTPNPRVERVEQETRGVVRGGYWVSTYGPYLLPGEHITPLASTNPEHHTHQP